MQDAARRASDRQDADVKSSAERCFCEDLSDATIRGRELHASLSKQDSTDQSSGVGSKRRRRQPALSGDGG